MSNPSPVPGPQLSNPPADPDGIPRRMPSSWEANAALSETSPMSVRYWLLMFVSLTCISGAASAQSNTFTQVGHWSCAIPACSPHEGDSSFVCPSVPFPQQFGTAPNMIFVNTSPTNGFIFSGNADITPQGFALRFHCGGFRGFRGWPQSTATGDWIAVGAEAHRSALAQQSGITATEYRKTPQRDPLPASSPRCPAVVRTSAPRAPRYWPIPDAIASQIVDDQPRCAREKLMTPPGQPAKALTEVRLIEGRTVAGANALLSAPTQK
jgi:hypothetical protein